MLFIVALCSLPYRQLRNYYGLGPHTHKDGILGSTEFTGEIPENFSPDGDGLGVYTHCLNCGGDGTYDGVVLEPKADTEG